MNYNRGASNIYWDLGLNQQLVEEATISKHSNGYFNLVKTSRFDTSKARGATINRSCDFRRVTRKFITAIIKSSIPDIDISEVRRKKNANFN